MEINKHYITNNKLVISFNIPENIKFYNASIIGPPDYNSEFTLFFSTNTNDQKWYSSKTDRSILVKKLSKIKDNWIFVIDDIRLLGHHKNYYILVNSVNLFIEYLVKEQLSYLNTKVIAITGSVGKTTLARTLSLLIDNSQIIDVKRLTPLNLADFVFNKLEPTTNFLITEVGLYYPGQVAYLANILSPYIGVITNIYDMHIGWNSIKSRSDLLTEKMSLLTNSQIRIVSSELFEEYSNSHSFHQKNIIHNDLDYLAIINSCKIFPKTNVSKNIFELIEIILNKCNCNSKLIEIIQTIQENASFLRFHKYNICTKEIYVDSHSSIAGYFQAMSCNWYESVLLIILSLNFPIEERIYENIQRIKKTFPFFTTICISNKLKHYFGNIENEQIKYISNKKFLKEIIKEQVIIIHDPKGVRFSKRNRKDWKGRKKDSVKFC